MLLVIKRIYDNNSLLVSLGKGREAIAQGKGIGYKRQKGETISSRNVEKIIYLTDQKLEKFMSLLKDVPLDIVLTTFDVIDSAKNDYKYPLLNYIYVTLTDHVYQMYKRLIAKKYQAISVPNVQLEYPLEYKIAAHAVKHINKSLNVHFPEEEIKNIALHFINAKGDKLVSAPGSKNMAFNVKQVVVEVLAGYHIKRNFENQNYFDRLMIHLQYLVERVENNKMDNQLIDVKLEKNLKADFPRSSSIATEICDKLEQRLSITYKVCLGYLQIRSMSSFKAFR